MSWHLGSCPEGAVDEIDYTFTIPAATIGAGLPQVWSYDEVTLDATSGLWIFDFERSTPLESDTPGQITLDSSLPDATEGYWPCDGSTAATYVKRLLPLPNACVNSLELNLGCPNCATLGWVHLRFDYISQDQLESPHSAYTFRVHGVRL